MLTNNKKSKTAEQYNVTGFKKWFLQTNWMLIFGLIMVTVIGYVAIYGQEIAPLNPSDAFLTIKSEGEWFTAPIPAFTVPEFPLGTDHLGRDLYSQILWAIRPTLLLVLLAATVRLILGVVIGMAAGWSSGKIGRISNILLSFGLAAPDFVVALAVVAALSIEGSLQAFIVGLSLTGWAESARLIRQQTRHVKGQLYVEASQSIGASNLQVLYQHVWRQIKSMIWMLFSFEVGSSLLVTATLGFLGYFIGGEVFVVVTDFTAERVSGTPELGQMLATSWISMAEPWGLFATGLAVLFMILGFNLTSEGLSKRLNSKYLGRRPFLSRSIASVMIFFDEYFYYPIGKWWRENAPRKVLTGLFGLIGIALISFTFMLTRQTEVSIVAAELIPVPGNHQWMGEAHDPGLTYFSSAIGPQASPDELWKFQSTFAIFGPVVAADGTIIVLDFGGLLHALDPIDGNVIWNYQLEDDINATGRPTLGLRGEIYIVDDEAGLTAISSTGEWLWYFAPEFNNVGQGGANVSIDGNIFYATAGAIQAVQPTGEELWFGLAKPNLTSEMPIISADGKLVFIDDVILSAVDGTKVSYPEIEDAIATTSTRFSRAFYMVSGAGENYLQSRNLVIKWSADNYIDGTIDQVIEWDQALTVLGDPPFQGLTPENVVWQLFTSFGGNNDTTLHWLDGDGKVLSNVQFVQRPTNLIGIDANSIAYTCGPNSTFDNFQIECAAWKMGEKEARWRVPVDPIETNRFVFGGALVDGRIYVSLVSVRGQRSFDGTLIALGDPNLPPTINQSPEGIEELVKIEPVNQYELPDISILDGLSIDEFFQQSYYQELLRDPQSITAKGISQLFPQVADQLTNQNIGYQERTFELQSALYEKLLSYDRNLLAPAQQVSYDIYKWYFEDTIKGNEFYLQNYSVNQLFGFHTAILNFFINDHPLSDETNVENYLIKFSKVETSVSDFIEGLTIRENEKVILPEYILDILLRQMSNNEGNVENTEIYNDFIREINQNSSFSVEQKEDWKKRFVEIYKDTVSPAMQDLKSYFNQAKENAYLKAGIWELPNGKEYYNYLLQHHTTTDMTAEEIHLLGLQQVDRIHGEIRELADQLGYPSDSTIQQIFERAAADGGVMMLQTPSQIEAAVEEFERLIKEAELSMSWAFDITPEMDLLVKAVPPENAGLPGGYYTLPSVDGTKPGIFWANLNWGQIDKYGMPTLAYHEGIPGHHFQLAIQLGLDLHDFRKGLTFTANVEGWALYAEHLAWEMGFYEDDPYGDLGRLQGQLFRAARLVVDTGIHAFGWSRAEARIYMDNTVGYPKGLMNNEVDRYIAWPGQATSYMVGMLKIIELRQSAIDQLGDQFVLSEFHNVVLSNGSVPLSILESLVQQYVDEKLVESQVP